MAGFDWSISAPRACSAALRDENRSCSLNGKKRSVLLKQVRRTGPQQSGMSRDCFTGAFDAR